MATSDSIIFQLIWRRTTSIFETFLRGRVLRSRKVFSAIHLNTHVPNSRPVESQKGKTQLFRRRLEVRRQIIALETQLFERVCLGDPNLPPLGFHLFSVHGRHLSSPELDLASVVRRHVGQLLTQAVACSNGLPLFFAELLDTLHQVTICGCL